MCQKLTVAACSVVVAFGGSGCALIPDQARGQHRGTTVMLVGLATQETSDQAASTLDCAKSTIAWAAKQGSKLMMAPIALPGDEQWSTREFALKTSAQKTNPKAAKKFQQQQAEHADADLQQMLANAPKESSLDLLAAATDGTRVLNYRGGPRTLVLCAAADQQSPELHLGSAVPSQHAMQLELFRLQRRLERMRLTQVVFGAAGDSAQPSESLTEQAAHEAFWRAWARHEGAIYFSYGPIPHFPYP
jgi:hypothetical protein